MNLPKVSAETDVSTRIQGIDPVQEERPWGNFRRFAKDLRSTVKIVTVNPGASLSLQSHTARSEFWHVIGGAGIAEIDGIKHEAVSGAEFHIPIGSKHRLSANEGSTLQILEITVGDFDENDIIRYEDKYGRVVNTKG